MTTYYLGDTNKKVPQEWDGSKQARETRTPEAAYITEFANRMEPRCECGTLLEGQYNNGEEHDECAICREGRLTDEAYEHGQEKGLFRD